MLLVPSVLIISKLSGTNGAYCNQCEHDAASANLRENIEAGFERTRTIQQTKQRYQELLQHPVVRILMPQDHFLKNIMKCYSKYEMMNVLEREII